MITGWDIALSHDYSPAFPRRAHGLMIMMMMMNVIASRVHVHTRNVHNAAHIHTG